MFLCNPQKSGASSVCITFLQITPKILTKDIFHWLELITEILSFLQIFSVRKITTRSKLQIIHGVTYITLFLPDSNNCFFICSVSYIPICLYYFLILCFYFHFPFHLLLATSHILQVTMFDSTLLQPVHNTTEIRNTS